MLGTCRSLGMRFVLQTYKFIDSHGAGSMSRDAAMQQGMTHEVFDSIDTDGSGDITLEEFIAFQRRIASD